MLLMHGLFFTPKHVATTVKEKLEEKVNKSTLTIIILQNQFGIPSVSDSFKLCYTIIVLILCFGIDILGVELTKQIGNVHDRFCKIVL